MEKIYDMLIVGGDPGGYTAALYAARAGLDVAVVEKLSAGGQMALSHQIDNYPGFEEGIDGFTLAQKMQSQAQRFGAQTVYAQVHSVDLQSEPKRLQTSKGTLLSRTVVIATGADPRQLGLPEEQMLIGKGVGYCAACDGMFYRGKTVVIIGGGNTAAADALLLSRVAEKVILVHRGHELRATKIYHKPLMEAENVEFRWNSRVVEILHEEKVTGVVLEQVQSGERSRLDAQGVFISIGREPATAWLQSAVALDDQGYVLAGEDTKTDLAGVYAVGDVRSKELRQIATAVADGAMAVHEAEKYLSVHG